MDNIYVYDRNTGFILYSIDNISDHQIQNLKNRNIPFIIANRASLLNQYVVTANGIPSGFDTIKKQDILADKQVIFSDGSDKIVFTGLASGTVVSIDGKQIWTSNTTDTSFAFSVNGYSTSNPVVRFQRYGYHKEQFQVITMMPPQPIDSMVS